MEKITIYIPKEVKDTLTELARLERRNAQTQAAIILTRELSSRTWLIRAASALVADTPQKAGG